MTGSLASVHPELIPEWSEKNLPLTPDKITFGSNKRVWWKGACGHEWETSVKARSKGEKCPICSGARVIEGINDLATLKPLLAQEWSKKNKLKPTEVSVASHKKIIWKCKHGHEWEASVKSRTVNGTGCPYCSHNKVLAGFNDGMIKGKLSFYCRMLKVSRQGFYKYLSTKNRPWKYQDLADAMINISTEDEYNDTYGRIRMYQALNLKQPEGVHIPSERTVYRVMEIIGLNHRPKRKPNGITKADREARKSEDLLKRNFKANEPLQKCITDITEIKAKDGKLYVSAIFDCFDSGVLGLAMETNMKATLCEHTLDNAYLAYPAIRGSIIHSDRGTQYTSETYRKALAKYGIIQSMNSAGGRCHDNARCESMWARMKSELLYDRYDTDTMTIEELKVLIWRYFISYWNNRRICSANGGLPPMVKRKRYYDSLEQVA